jgi:hypothetical protein
MENALLLTRNLQKQSYRSLLIINEFIENILKYKSMTAKSIILSVICLFIGWPFLLAQVPENVTVTNDSTCSQVEIMNSSFEFSENELNDANAFRDGLDGWCSPIKAYQSPEIWSNLQTGTSNWTLSGSLPPKTPSGYYYAAMAVNSEVANDPCDNAEQIVFQNCNIYRQGVTYTLKFIFRVYVLNYGSVSLSNWSNATMPPLDIRLSNRLDRDSTCSIVNRYATIKQSGQSIWKSDSLTAAQKTILSSGGWVTITQKFTPTKDYKNLWIRPMSSTIAPYWFMVDGVSITSCCSDLAAAKIPSNLGVNYVAQMLTSNTYRLSSLSASNDATLSTLTDDNNNNIVLSNAYDQCVAGSWEIKVGLDWIPFDISTQIFDVGVDYLMRLKFNYNGSSISCRNFTVRVNPGPQP